nr:atrial natriuretic peptide receptor 2-like [Biomphalaria glabrata]
MAEVSFDIKNNKKEILPCTCDFFPLFHINLENAGHDDTSAQQYILSGYYNSFLVYLTAVNETLAVGGNISDGISLVKRMCNRTYLDGSDDEFQISDQANRVVNMEVASMLDEQNGTFETIADFKVLTETLIFKRPEYETGWLSDGEYVLDTPSCGYLGQYCVSSDSSLQTALIASFLIILLIIGVSVVIILRLRYIQRLKNLYWWRLEPGELQSMKVHLTRSALSTSIHQASLNTLDTRASNREPLLGFLKGQISQMHALPHLHVSVNAGLLKEFEKIRDINHPNLLRVLGACLEGDKKVIITEYCQKGTLQLLLMDASFKLDSVFALCIINDIVRALAYLHKHPIRVHGRLTSEVCMIDSRFSVKVGYYGLPSIYGSIKEVNKSLEVDNIWLAPELAHCPDISTQKGDIYSLAVIMSEILAHDDISTISKSHSASRVTSATRQDDSILSSKVKDSNDMLAMEHLMRECLARDPDKRPSIDRIHGIMHALMLRSNQSGSLVDNLLQRLEKYSSNLERIVDEKVEELRQEKHKSEELLRQMLPTPVADRLKAGLLVEPEFYDCVTIYFSDIVGFTDICSMLEPVHIVKMLNDLYSCFDGIIEHFDVYKVETIGDAYMVVSGLPTRNGNEHARQIARMSLVLLTATSSLEPVNTPTLDRIKIRIGLNSGPVCAGVVGHKMPRYCLFGDAVNIASRMESNGSESKIHTSLSTAKILKTFGTFILESRGVVSIKGKGKMETFWLIGENV